MQDSNQFHDILWLDRDSDMPAAKFAGLYACMGCGALLRVQADGMPNHNCSAIRSTFEETLTEPFESSS